MTGHMSDLRSQAASHLQEPTALILDDALSFWDARFARSPVTRSFLNQW